ncbi:MAG TPA: hypothetical protein ENN25_05625 [Euryarchaeota archaeon]|nr:hypothetical protein [Euryarchaeota archaeon]
MIDQINREIRPEFFTVLPQIIEWIKNNKNMTNAELRAFIKIHPTLCEYLTKTPLEEIFEACSELRDHRIYGKHLEAVISSKGALTLNYHFHSKSGLTKE